MMRGLYQQVRLLHYTSHLLKETHYDILKLPHDTNISDIKSRFKKLSLKLHPDMLNSQGLEADELDKKSKEYLKVKKSYEVLSDQGKRREYDLQMGIRRRDGSSTGEFLKQKGTTQHFHEASRRSNDVPHFDSKKHQERNERVEKRFMYNQKVTQNVDLFGRNLYARDLGQNGPKKGIYRDYGRSRSVHEQEAEGKKIALKLVGGVIGVMVVWYVLCGTFSTKKSVEEGKNTEAVATATTTATLEPIIVEEKNSVSRSGSKMSVNNKYGMMLIKKEYESPSDIEVFEEQISEAAE